MTDDDATRPPAPPDEARRRAYLEAMGIPLWVPRDAADPAAEGGSGMAQDDAAGDVGTTTAVQAPQAGPAASACGADEPLPLPAEPADALAGQAPEPGAAAAATDAGTGSAVEAGAVAAMGWDDLRAAVLGCTACELCNTRTQAVPGVGSAAADLLVIGEAPGQEEDRRGEPFVGRAGQLLDRMLAAIGLDRDTVFITNVLKCRPPKNRDPKPEEVQACAPYLRRQIELISPRAILSVGRISAQSLLETGDSIGRLRGRWHRFGPQGTPLLITYHPAYLLRTPVDKRKAWADLKAVRDRLRG